MLDVTCTYCSGPHPVHGFCTGGAFYSAEHRVVDCACSARGHEPQPEAA